MFWNLAFNTRSYIFSEINRNIRCFEIGDIKTQSESVSRLVQSGVYTVNEARKYLGMPDTNNGDTIMVNGAYVRLEEIGKAYQKNDLKGGE